MLKPDHKQAIAYAFNRLRGELSPKFTYHTFWHTHGDVLPGCQRIAHQMGVTEEEINLLEVGAAFHDIGFVEDYVNHELIGARIAAQTLPNFGFSEREITAVMGMIMATRLPQAPRNLLEEILADADLGVLGRDDFFVRNDYLRQEWENFRGKVHTRKWNEAQLAFLENHTYFTSEARMFGDAMKQQHIAVLKGKLQLLDK